MEMLKPSAPDLTLKWASVPSVTGEEQALLKMVEFDLSALGWSVGRIPVTNNDRYNLLAGLESGSVLFSTHLDTVPPYTTPERQGDQLRGRGVLDAKGQAASMLVAASELRDMGVQTSLLFVVGEETDSDGAKAAAECGLAFDYVINGEPTNNRFAAAQKGNLRVELEAFGIACHSGYPEQGRSAIETLLTVLAEMKDVDWPVDDLLGVTTMNIGTIHGGVADNVLADHAVARVMFRTVCPWKTMLERVEELVHGRLTVRFVKGVDPLHLHLPEGFESTVVSFGSDAPHLCRIGTVMMLGPGSILRAHGVDEYITIGELDEAVSLYKEIALRLSGERS